MKATGIIRRVDDLGRVVIPKELRRSMKIKEGAPLEIYTHNGAVCFKPYFPIGGQDWEKAKHILDIVLSCGFALLDHYGEEQASIVRESNNFDIPLEVSINGNVVAYLALSSKENEVGVVTNEVRNAITILQKLFYDAM